MSNDGNNNKLADALIGYIVSFPDGITNEHLKVFGSEHGLTDMAAVGVLNQLLSVSRVSILKDGNTVIYRAVAEDKANRLMSLTSQENLVYTFIEREGNKGIWIKDQRKRSNISSPQALEKILKTLCARKIIKTTDSIASKNKKVYMLYEQTPSVEVSGGAFYKGHDMDLSFIKNLKDICTTLLTKHKALTASDILDLIVENKVLTVSLSVDNIATVLQSQVYSREVEITTYFDLDFVRREEYKAGHLQAEPAEEEHAAKRRKLDNNHYQEAVADVEEVEELDPVYSLANTKAKYASPLVTNPPCLGCEYLLICKPGTAIEPATCAYFTQWLENEW